MEESKLSELATLCVMAVLILAATGLCWIVSLIFSAIRKWREDRIKELVREVIKEAEPLNDLSKSWHGHLTPEEINQRGLRERLMQLAREEVK